MELTSSDIFLRLLAVFVLITINAFFVTAEFSIVSVRRSRIQHLAESGDYPAQFVRDLHQHIERLLSTTQLGITLSSLALGWIGQDAIAKPLLLAFTQWLPIPVSDTLARSIAIPMAFCFIAYLQLVLGELCPKSVALIYAEELSRLLAPPSVVIARFFKPFIWGLNHSTRWLLQTLGIRHDPTNAANQLTPEELQLIISTSAESSGLREEERERLANLFEFGDAVAEEVMVPRTQIVALDQTDTVQSLLQELSESGHSRYPVIGESVDDIRGIIAFKDIAHVLVTPGMSMEASIQPWIAQPHFIPESMALGDVLEVMQKTGQAMLIVVDEFGGTAGLITLQDLMSEILGDRYDTDDPDDDEWQQLDEHTFLIQAQVPLDDVNDIINGELPVTDDYHTLAGFMIHHLQRIPEQGAMLHYDPWELTLIEAEDNRLHKIQIRWSPPEPDVLSDRDRMQDYLENTRNVDSSDSDANLNTDTDVDSINPDVVDESGFNSDDSTLSTRFSPLSNTDRANTDQANTDRANADRGNPNEAECSMSQVGFTATVCDSPGVVSSQPPVPPSLSS